MGFNAFDQYSLLHFAFGVIAYFYGLSLKNWVIVHTLFEIIENIPQVTKFINQNMSFINWSKPHPDSLLNNIGDTISALLGFLIAQYLDKKGIKENWIYN